MTRPICCRVIWVVIMPHRGPMNTTDLTFRPAMVKTTSRRRSGNCGSILNWINWWIRLGKQQIAWGDLPEDRICDKINPLDKSWHLTGEPDEYQNIRIPEWTARVYYTFPETVTGIFDEVFIDTFYNPGDIHPDNQPVCGFPVYTGVLFKQNVMALKG